MKLLDLFCGAGGAAMGYYNAGFDVIVGVDCKPQKNYPFEFVQADVFDYLDCNSASRFDLIHASPPCQGYSVTCGLSSGEHPKLIPQVRERLIAIGGPYVIENVPGAPLINPIMLCGTMFGLRVIRHRLFETVPTIFFAPATCNHWGKSTSSARSSMRRSAQSGLRRGVASLSDGYAFVTVFGHDFLVDDAKLAMGIDWMTQRELAQAIPPAYTNWLGKKILSLIKEKENVKF